MKYLVVFILFFFLISCNSFLQAQWVKTNCPYKKAIYCFSINGTDIFAGTYQGGVFLSTNYGTNWDQINNGITDSVIRSLANNGSNIFAGSSNNGLFLSTNNGTNWKTLSNGLSGDYIIYSLAVKGTDVFAGTWGNGIQLSTNNGLSWITINNGLTEKFISALALSENNIFAGTSDSGVFLSTNYGANWTKADNGLPNIRISAIAVSGNNIFVGTEGFGVFRSTDNGTNWVDINNGLSNAMVEALTRSGTNIFAGSYGGVCLTTNYGTTWIPVNDGLYENIYIWSLAVDGSYIYVGTDTTGIWRRPLSELVGITKENAELPKQFVLSQNYPNPFNPSTVINYHVSANSHVTLKIYNLLGVVVRTLVDERQSPGNYSSPFEAKDLPSGIYFYKLEAGQFTQVKKMILVK